MKQQFRESEPGQSQAISLSLEGSVENPGKWKWLKFTGHSNKEKKHAQRDGEREIQRDKERKRKNIASVVQINQLQTKDFPDGSAGKESACNAGDIGYAGLIPGSGRSPGGVNGNPLQYFLPEKSHEQRSLAGYSPKGLKESDTTEQLSMCTHVCVCTHTHTGCFNST